MRTKDVVAVTGVSKALRYYESLGLLRPARLPNGYRHYDEQDLRLVEQVRSLAAAGVPAGRVGPFLECLSSGHAHADDCPASLATYRVLVEELTERIEALTTQRDTLRAQLHTAARRRSSGRRCTMTTLDQLPEPHDDGAADHLPGRRLPALRLPSTTGESVDLAGLGAGRTIIYVYPLTGRPGVDLPEGWDVILGARGCTPEACDFRDHHTELLAAGASAVFGLSAQDPAHQGEVVDRLRLPFAMLSDQTLTLADALGLPSFSAAGMTLYKRLTLVVTDGTIEHAFYPVFPPDEHATEVLDWLRGREASTAREEGRSPVSAAGHVLLVSGSTRRGSTNTAVLNTAQVVSAENVVTVLYSGLTQLPAFNPDDDHDPLPQAVADLRKQIAAADAVLFCTPEYAGALPGSFKNLLDWTVGGGEIYGKPVAWINASSVAAPTAGAAAHTSLATVRGYVGADVVEAACQRMPMTRQAVGPDGVVNDPELREHIATVLHHTLSGTTRT